LLLKKVYFVLFFMFLLFMLTPAYGEVDRDVLNNVIHSFWAPDFCGMNLADCPASSAEEMRNQITQMLEQGKSKQDIINFYTNLYGTKILAEPPKTGIFAAVWVMPAVAVIAGVFLVQAVVRKRKQKENYHIKNQVSVDENTVVEIEKELKKYF